MLSILIPTYNYNIRKLVNIVWNECITEPLEFEIIVIDDCSTDLSLTNDNSKIEQLEFCKYFVNKRNIGRAATRDKLCEKAKYSWLLFLDADTIPKYKGFISRFNLKDNTSASVIYGGISYDYVKPKRDKVLRWVYGREREEKSVSERLKSPYFVMSSTLMIRKNIFIDCNNLKANIYGLDILFSNNLKQQNITIKHIDNPILHLGLENTNIFIKKSLDAVKTTYLLENKKLIDKDLRPLQKSFLKLQKWKLLGIFSFAILLVKKRMKKNFHSLKPNLFWFDLYRLAYFIDLKLKKNA